MEADGLDFDRLRRIVETLRRQAGSCRRRHHRRQPDVHDDDRRHDQDADAERALRQSDGLRRRRRHRRQAPQVGRCRGHVLDRAGRRRAGRVRAQGSRERGVNIMPIIDRARPTTHKNAYVCGDYRLLKVDTLDNRSITDKQAEMIAEQIANVHADAVVFSDFRHGIFNRARFPGLTGAIPKGAFRVADSQVASRWGNILEFKGFDLLTPNEREARFALADQDTGRAAAGRQAARGSRLQDGHSQARRSRRSDLPRAAKRTTRARSSWSTASPTRWSTRSAPATLFWPMRRFRC